MPFARARARHPRRTAREFAHRLRSRPDSGIGQTREPVHATVLPIGGLRDPSTRSLPLPRCWPPSRVRRRCEAQPKPSPAHARRARRRAAWPRRRTPSRLAANWERRAQCRARGHHDGLRASAPADRDAREGVDVVRVLDGERHWRRARDGTLGPVSDETLATDRPGTRATCIAAHRIAGRPALRLSAPRPGLLEVHEGGARIAWYALDASGSRTATARTTIEAGAIFGPWRRGRGHQAPVWGHPDNGAWRAMLNASRSTLPWTTPSSHAP